MDIVLKENEKKELSKAFTASLTEKGIQQVELTDTYYMDKRSAAEPVGYLVLLYLAGIADIVSILTAIWTVLKERDSKKEVIVEVGDIVVKVRGDMSQKEVIELVREAERTADKRKK